MMVTPQDTTVISDIDVEGGIKFVAAREGQAIAIPQRWAPLAEAITSAINASDIGLAYDFDDETNEIILSTRSPNLRVTDDNRALLGTRVLDRNLDLQIGDRVPALFDADMTDDPQVAVVHVEGIRVEVRPDRQVRRYVDTGQRRKSISRERAPTSAPAVR